MLGGIGRELAAKLMQKLRAAKVEKFPKYSAATAKKVRQYTLGEWKLKCDRKT